MTGTPISPLEAFLVVLFRLCVGWMFLWAGIHHFGDGGFVTGQAIAADGGMTLRI